MTERTADLDVVVLGGGGHVGLPLSLAFAQAGLRVGIYDTNQQTLDRIAAGEMPFIETGADELLVPLDKVLAEGDIQVLGAPHRQNHRLQVGGKDIGDVWVAIGEGNQL